MNGLKETRKALGLTQDDLSSVTRLIDPRIDTPMISRFENGLCLPTSEVSEALEAYLQAAKSEKGETETVSECNLTSENQPHDTAPQIKRETIAQFIPFGRENAVTREYLSTVTGASDRQVRREIESARRAGAVIINEQDGRGYYQTNDPAEIREQYRQDTARAMSILVRRKHLRRALIEAGEKV